MHVGLHGPGWFYVLGILPRADLALSTSRARATDLDHGQNLRKGSGRAPCVPQHREHEKRPAAGRGKNVKEPKKTHLYMCARLSFGEWDVYRGLTQAGMPQGKIIKRHPAVVAA